MAKTFVLLMSQRGSKKISADEIQAKLETFTRDWLRTGTNQYFIRYDGLSTTIFNNIRPLIDPKDDILVCEVVPGTEQGWTQKIAVDWFDKYR